MPCLPSSPLRFPLLALSALMLTLVVAPSAVTATDSVSPEWLPLEVGSSWVYQDEAGERLTIRVSARADDEELAEQGDCYRITWNDDLLGPSYQAEVWCRNGAEVRLAAKELSGSRLPMEGAAVLLREPLVPGSNWDSTFVLGGEELATRGVVVGRETVVTPSGDYEAMHVRIEQPSGDVDRWYVQGVGIVQEETSLFGRSLGRKSLARHVGTTAPETVALFDAPAEPLQPESASSDDLDEGIISDTLTDDTEPLFPEEADTDLARYEATEPVAEPIPAPAEPAAAEPAPIERGVTSHPEFDAAWQEDDLEPLAEEAVEPARVADPEPPAAEAVAAPEPFVVAEATSPESEESEVPSESYSHTEPLFEESSDEDVAEQDPELETEEISDTSEASSATTWTVQDGASSTDEECDVVGTYLVMVGGEVVPTEEGWELDGRRVLYRNHANALLALRTSAIDFEETERRQREECEAQAERERVKPEPPPRNWLEAAQRRPEEAVALELADGDLEPDTRVRRSGAATSDAVHVLLQMGVDTSVLTGLDEGGELASVESVLRQQQSDLQARLNPYRDRIDEGPAMSAAVADEVLLTARQLSRMAERESRGPLREAYEQIGSELERAATRMRSDPLEATRLLALLSG